MQQFITNLFSSDNNLYLMLLIIIGPLLALNFLRMFAVFVYRRIRKPPDGQSVPRE